MTETYSIIKYQWRSPLLKFNLPSLFFLLILSVCGNTAIANPAPVLSAMDVSGRVLDETGKGMPGVNILVKGTTNGTTTDTDGNYKISVDNGDAILVFSFIGYLTQEVTVGTRNVIDLTLQPDVETLSEIVVVGYGTQAKGSVTGAVASVNAKEITALPVPSVSQALQGRVPGVMVTNNGGPGQSAIVRIRGIGSVTQNADPLYVVDGFPAPNFNLNSIDTKDIESVEILKDAAATAVYGSRAANGVVLITTKTGSKDQQVHVDIDAYAGTQKAWKKLDLLKTDEYVAYGTALQTNAGLNPPSRFGNLDQPIYAGSNQTFAQTQTDWQDEMFRSAPIWQLQGSVSAATEKTKVYLSFGRFKQVGIMLGTGYDRYNGRLNVETKISNRFTIGESLQITQSNNQNQLESGGRTMVMHMLRQVPYITVRNPNTIGGYNGPTTADGSDAENPVRLAEMDTRKNHNLYILSNTFVQFKINEALKYKFTFGVNSSADRYRENNPIYDDFGYQSRDFHEMRDNRTNYYSLYYSNQLTFDKTFGDHVVNAVVVGERQDEKNQYLNTYGQTTTNAIDNLTGGTNLTVDNQSWEMYLLSFLGRVNYEFKGKYLASISMRRDGFSGFAPDHKWGNFPGASVGWKVNEESFMAAVDQISDLKLRASYGKVGSKPTEAYSYVSPILTGTFYPFNGTLYQGAYYQKLPNEEFGWEISTMKNVGLDLGMFSNKLTFSVDYFIKDTEDLILSVPAPRSMGLDQGTLINIADMTNSGFEFTLGYNKIAKDFTFNASANASIIENVINELNSATAAIYAGNSQDYGAGDITRTIAGSSIQHFYLYETDGIFQNESEIVNAEGKPTQAGLNLPIQDDGTVDMTKWQDPANAGKYTRPGDIRFTGKQKDMGSYLPKFSYGLNLSATYKGMDFTMFIQGVSGNKIYNGTRVITEGMLRLFNSGDEVMNAWRPDNTNTDIPRAVAGDPNSNTKPSDRFLEDGSYARIKNLTIGYTLPTSLFSFTNGTIKKFRIYFSAQNLATITNYKGYDPEVGNRNINNFGDNNRFLVNGIDYGQFPQPRTFIGGVQLGF